tara:strand:- start:11972 stop:13135 length:1164 start_codon:yes stop_codon:yes gene_type:complete
MTWKKNPRVITDEQFSEGTTIDGNRIDRAVQDVQDRVNSVPYGDLQSRWTPTTYVCGWMPQNTRAIKFSSSKQDHGDPSDISGSDGNVYALHHWPWMRMKNDTSQVPPEETGSSSGDSVSFRNPYRVKGALAPGIYPKGFADITDVQFGEQYCWTRSWFLSQPTILDAIDLVMIVDCPKILDSANPPRRQFQNAFQYDTFVGNFVQYIPGATNLFDRGLALSATVDSLFDPETRTMSDVEVMRRDFEIANDSITVMGVPTSLNGVGNSNIPDMKPLAGNSQTGLVGETGGGSLFGVHISLKDLNIPLPNNSRLRIHTVIPRYVREAISSDPGFGSDSSLQIYMNNFSKDLYDDNDNESTQRGGWGFMPWYAQQMNMTVTMLEEVISG